MKHLEIIFRTLLWVFLMLPVCEMQASEVTENPFDSLEISLLTCSPHEEIYSLYGHTALRYHDLRTDEDVVLNWGLFNFNAPHFVARFILGKTDYEVGPASLRLFCRYYEKWGSSVTEQVLNLTAEEKRDIMNALNENLKPENRVYRYNFFFDNCATRPRDIIERNLHGKLQYSPRPDYQPSFRDIIRLQTRNHPWATFGNDILLGFKADMKTTRQEQEFLPANILYDFDHATIYNPDGSNRPLVSERRVLVPPGVQQIQNDFPLSPTECFILLLLLSILFLYLEWKKRKTYPYWDVTLMLLTGLAGCLLFIMLFSEHPCTSSNLQIFLLNPLPLFFIPSVFRRRKTHWWKISLCLIILFIIGGFWQSYAGGMYILALCLLTRFCSHLKHEK